MKSDVIHKPSHSPQPKLSTYPPLTLPSRSYGTVPYSRNSLFPSRQPQPFLLITKPRSQSHTTRNFMPARNTSTSIFISYAISFPREFSIPSMSTHTTTLPTYSPRDFHDDNTKISLTVLGYYPAKGECWSKYGPAPMHKIMC